MLIDEDAVARVLRPEQIRTRSSGSPIDDEQSAALEALLATSPLVDAGGKRDWTTAELQAIVADYFSMLQDELAGRSYSKTEHRNALRTIVQRSPGSIERKHMNISAVLQKLGLPWINGYKPYGHFQDALVDAIEARLHEGGIQYLEQAPLPVVGEPVNVSGIFVPPPSHSIRSKERSITRVITKYDLASRDAANRALGKQAKNMYGS